MKFHHIGIFVKNLNIGKKHLVKILNIKKSSQQFHDKSLKVSIQFFYDKSGIVYEIVAPLGKNNPVKKVLQENKNILNHIAYKTSNFDKTIKKLRKKGCAPLGPAKKALAFNHARVIFFVTPLNFIIEIIEQLNKGKKKN